MSEATATPAGDAAPMPLKLLDKAMGALRTLGFVKEDPEEAPIVALIEKVAPLAPDTAAAIARTLSQASLFNKVVREQISAVSIGQRYREITDGFDSIREDAKRMVDQVEDGKLSTFERVSNVWMKVTRGDIPHRFDEIRETYLDVAEDTRDQIQREDRVLEAYADFRGALKESEVLGFKILKKAEVALNEDKQALEGAVKDLEAFKGEDREESARLEMNRDLKLRAVQDEDERYQICKDLAENLSIAYNTTEVIMARLKQITSAKQRVYSQAITFFGTNETVFTALSASFTGMSGLFEATKTLEAMKEGINKSLETLGEEGTKIQEEALKAGYGPTIRVASVQKLVDAVVNYQERSRKIIDEMRDLATQNEKEVRKAVEDGKLRLIALQERAARLPAPQSTATETPEPAGA